MVQQAAQSDDGDAAASNIGPGADKMASGAICANCANLYIVNKSDPWWRWLCQAKPRREWTNYVTGLHAADPPYSACKDINHSGACPMFVAGPNSLKPREMPI